MVPYFMNPGIHSEDIEDVSASIVLIFTNMSSNIWSIIQALAKALVVRFV